MKSVVRVFRRVKVHLLNSTLLSIMQIYIVFAARCKCLDWKLEHLLWQPFPLVAHKARKTG